MTDDSRNEDFNVADSSFVTADGGRYLFPDEYTFQTDGDSLQILDGNGKVVLILPVGAWNAVVGIGATFHWESSEDDGDDSGGDEGD